jgi:uncharacterized protein
MLRNVVFLIVIVVTLSAMVVYVGKRASELFRWGTRRRRALTGSLYAVVAFPFGLRVANLHDMPVEVARLALGVGLAVIVASAGLMTVDAASFVIRRVRALRARNSPSKSSSSERVSADALATHERVAEPDSPASRDAPLLDHARRDFLRSAGIGASLSVGAGTSLYGSLIGRHDYRLEDQVIPIRGLPSALEGYTIAQISDVHVGTFVGDYELGAGLDLIRRARPDAIVLTGDLVDHDVAYVGQLGRFARQLTELGVRDGVSAVPGNHDYYAGVEAVLAALRSAGVNVLRNDARTIGEGKVSLLGVDDVWAARSGFPQNRPDLQRAISRAPEGLPKILLCHNPETYDEHAPFVDLQLSGHTHGGQVNLVVRPADLILRHGYIAGHYVKGDSQVYVNRVGSPPEVTRIVLVRA